VVRLIRAEFLKLRTTQVWFWLLLAALAISSLIAVGSLAGKEGVHTQSDVPDIFGNANGASMVVFVLGVLGVTTEFRYQTITATVLTTPSRWALITAKLVSYALVGAAYALLCIGAQAAIAAPWLSSRNVEFSLSDSKLRHVIFGVFLIHTLFAIIGIGFGALLRNQIVAVTVGVIFLAVLENIILAIPVIKHAWPYTPSGAVTAIIYTHGDTEANGVHILGTGGGVLVLLLWAFVPAILGAGITMNRDIT
jgi:ABC-2 type transport system permease protein